MNIYEEIKEINKNSQNKIALGLVKTDGTLLKYTYKEVFEKVEMCSNNLIKLGVKQGYRIAIVAQSSPEWVITYLAIQKIKATAVCIDASLEKEEILKLIEKSDLRAIIFSRDIYNKIGIIKDMPNLKLENFGQLFADSKISECREIKVKENTNISTIIYSSGTTKTASGIMHTSDSLINTTKMTIKAVGLKRNSVFLGMLPNSHIYGVITQILGPLFLSSAVYNLEELSAECLINSLKNCKPNIIPAVPKIYELLYSQIKKKIESKNTTKKLYNKLFPICLRIRKKTGINLGKYIFSSVQKGFGGKVKFMCSAGSPMPEEVANFYYGTGFKMLITYGATETNIPTVGNYGKNLTMNSCGRNYPDIKIKIAENGELLIKSPYMMEGYFNDEIATKEAFDKEGWFLSGDLARINKEGNIEILGRCKENIVLATGKKIAPDDIENNYQDIPFVKDFTVCGIPVKERSYDEVHCFVVADFQYREQIENAIKQKSSESSKNMKIAGIHFVDSIPRTALKKPKRFLLKKMVFNEKESVQVIKQRPKTVREVVYCLLAEIANINVLEIKDNTKILQELPIDSLSTIELSIELEKLYDIKIEKFITKNTTVKSLIEMIENPPITPKDKIKQYLTKYPITRKDIDYKIFKFYSNLLKKIYKITVKEDKSLPEDTGYIVCSNHVSNFDYLYLTANFHKDRFKKFYCVAKQELFTRNPINKLFVRIAGMIPVERTGIAVDTIRKVSERIKEKSGVIIFPEGTRSKTGKLGECKKGAAMISLENSVPIIPAYIEGAYEIYPPNRKLPKLYNWKQKKKYEVNVIYGKPIFPKGKSIEQITKEVNNAILELSYSL